MTLTVHLADGAGTRQVADALRAQELNVVTGEVGDVTVVVGGEDAIRAAAEAGARRILVIVDEVDRRSATALLEAGASGVVVAGTPETAIADALRALTAGFIVLPEAARMAVKHPVLTVRQQEILRLLVLGLGNAEIARKLYVSENTVKTHMRALFAKLEVSSRQDAIALVLDRSSPLRAGVLGFSPPRDDAGGYRSPEIR